MSKTTKTNRQYEQEKSKGKLKYRKRIIQEHEAEEEISFVFFNELSTETIIDNKDKNCK